MMKNPDDIFRLASSEKMIPLHSFSPAEKILYLSLHCMFIDFLDQRITKVEATKMRKKAYEQYEIDCANMVQLDATPNMEPDKVLKESLNQYAEGRFGELYKAAAKRVIPSPINWPDELCYRRLRTVITDLVSDRISVNEYNHKIETVENRYKMDLMREDQIDREHKRANDAAELLTSIYTALREPTEDLRNHPTQRSASAAVKAIEDNVFALFEDKTP